MLLFTVPGEISDPYVPHPHLQTQPLPPERTYERPAHSGGGMRPLAPAMDHFCERDLKMLPQPAAQQIERQETEASSPMVSATDSYDRSSYGSTVFGARRPAGIYAG